MKAIRIGKFGGSEEMEHVDVPDPEPGPDDVLVEVHAAGVNPVDWKVREGWLKSIFVPDFPYTPGRDLSGVVLALGGDVEGFAVGDEVYGTALPTRDGSFAELIAVGADSIAHKPRSVDHIEAASLPVAGLSAWTGIVGVGRLAAREKVLIHAGAGGVGSLAIQLAKHVGATVAATAGAANAEYVRKLGADVVIDYRNEDFAAALSDYDLVFDTMGGEVHRRSYAVLRPGGRITYLSAVPIEGPPPSDDVTAERAAVVYDTETFEIFAALVDAGAVRPQVTSVMPLADARRAFEEVRTGHQRGKIVLRVR